MCGADMLIELKAFREGLGMTQEEMAISIGVSKSYYIKVEEGYRNPSYNFLKKFKACYNTEIDCIFFVTNTT